MFQSCNIVITLNDLNRVMKRITLTLLYLLGSVNLFAQIEVDAIAKAAREFSENFVNGNYAAMHDAYWDDAVIHPPDRDILKGKEAIKSYWAFGPNFKQLYHRSIADSIIIAGTFAIDYGYWYSESMRGDQHGPVYSGKYVIVWEKRNGVWKMLQDIWNNRSSDWIPKRPDE